jgi:hypothetical protein
MKFFLTHKSFSVNGLLCVLCALCGLVAHASALDRNAFTFTKYNLTATVDPSQQRLGVRGMITLRNDSTAPQKNVALQISSTLDWISIEFDHKSVEFLTHTYTSDIDHTGELSEAIVTLPREVKPTETIELAVGYEGTVALDTTRLTRIGIGTKTATRTDWDQINTAFTAVRGVGYVAWYPVAMDAASLSDGDSVEQTVGRWKQRQAESSMHVLFESNVDKTILFSGGANLFAVDAPKEIVKVADFTMSRFGTDVPTFAITDSPKLSLSDNSSAYYLKADESAARSIVQQIKDLSGTLSIYRSETGINILDNPNSEAEPFSSTRLLIMPLDSSAADETTFTLIYALVHGGFRWHRPWVQEGLAHYAQAEYLEQKNGRQAALDYLNAHEAELVESEKTNSAAPHPDDNSLLNGIDNIQFQSKAMRVWWMLQDMLRPNADITDIMWSYQSSDDQSNDYIQKMIEAKTHLDLQWFFDDWVYHDRGLPDFHVLSVFPSKLPSGGYLVTVTVENLGEAGAEVPVTLQFDGGSKMQRLQVLRKSKNSIRFEVPGAPQQVTINDGSVPERDTSNNTFTITK